MTISTINIPVPILSKDNYEDWYSQMKTFLQAQDLWEIVQDGFVSPGNQSTLSATEQKKLNEDQQKNSIALCFLQQAVTKSKFSRIRDMCSSQEIWQM